MNEAGFESVVSDGAWHPAHPSCENSSRPRSADQFCGIVGGGASADQVKNAFRILLSDPNVKAVLINIFGGILRCDTLATGVVGAVVLANVPLPSWPASLFPQTHTVPSDFSAMVWNRPVAMATTPLTPVA